MEEILETKVTRLTKDGIYGCRVIIKATGKPIVELRVPKHLIADAFYDMLRTLDKLGYNSKMADSSRHRGKGNLVHYKYIWY